MSELFLSELKIRKRPPETVWMRMCCRLRDECLNANWFISLSDARRKIATCRARLQPTTSARFVELLATRRICTNSNGDEDIRKTSTELLEQGTQAPSPAPDLIPPETKSTEDSHWDWYSKMGHFTGTARTPCFGGNRTAGAHRLLNEGMTPDRDAFSTANPTY